MDKILEMRQKRAALVKQARDILDRAEAEKRGLTAEEEQQYSKIMSDVEELRKAIEREERLQALERELAQSQGTIVGGKEPVGDDNRAGQQAEEVRAAFNKFLRGGIQVLSHEEARALQAGVDTLGGYIVAPQQFVNQLIKAVDDLVFIRPLATKFTVEQAESLGVPSLDSDMDDADWTAELATGREDTGLAFGKRQLAPHPLAKRIKVSNQLMRQAVIDPEALMRDRLAYKFSITQEKAYLTGDGVDKPLGLFVASNQGISTDRDVVAGTATDLTFDGLTSAKYSLKQQYWPRARWLFHRNAVERIAKLKDANGQYIWRESTRAGEPDRLLGFPVMMSEYVPNTFTSGQYVGMLGDFSFYWIVDALNMQIQRLVELYAESNQIGFIGRYEGDGMPVLEEAFVRCKLG
ncbi:phage major capsid protein [Marinobacter sp.]|uniref:phage major capsid protein n=1 Tax=Marinobacter sp. TaxID=50741 RepID=UPI0019C81463|nr:phage major capsid protein [Marinobacter sp.]MBC7193873.1 phage major capsid protein [Marinobacter sp.]